MTRTRWDAYYPHTKHLAVARLVDHWYVVDMATDQQIGQPFPTMHEARAYAEHRQRTTYSP